MSSTLLMSRKDKIEMLRTALIRQLVRHTGLGNVTFELYIASNTGKIL